MGNTTSLILTAAAGIGAYWYFTRPKALPAPEEGGPPVYETTDPDIYASPGLLDWRIGRGGRGHRLAIRGKF